LLDQDRDNGPATGNVGLNAGSGPAPAWPGFQPLRIARKVRESSNVVSLTLEPTDQHPLAAALPGQFVVLRLKPSPETPALIRSYSLSGKPDPDRYRVSVKRERSGVAGAYINEKLEVGDVVEVSAARGAFILRSGDAPVALLSAGIGATPVLAMLHALVAEVSSREIWWLHGARNRREHAFAEEVSTLLKALTHGHSHIRYSAPDPDDRPAIDFDAAGRLDIHALEELGVPRNSDFYLCGPAAFMSDLTIGLKGIGVPASRIHSEIFGSSPSSTPGIARSAPKRPHPPAAADADGPRISFARSGLEVRWGARFANLLELAEACDVEVRWSCRTGVCHSCETALIAGTVDYAPDPIEAPADGNVLICCCKPRADITIDL
jgi:ferredoxin-NADP reductase